MKTITLRQKHDVGKLQAELEKALPSLRPKENAEGQLEARFILCSAGDLLELQVPPNTKEDSIRRVLDAHDPTPLPPPPDLLDEAEEAIAAVTDKTTKTALTKLLAAMR